MSLEHLKKKPLVEWLEEVDYSLDRKYIPSDFALQFVTFIKLVNGSEGEEHKTPVLHLKMLDQIAAGETRIANMLFRGAAKTTVLCEYMVLYLAYYGELPVFGAIDLILYVSDSMENGVKNFRKNVEYRWENSEFLKHGIPKIKFTDSRLEFINLDGLKVIVKCYGAKTGVRGTKEMGKRPQLALLDDLISDDDARSDTEIRNIESTIYNAIDYALHPTRNMILWAGTPYNGKDPLYKAVESGAWSVNVFPVCEKFPCTEEEFKGAWPERFPYSAVRDKYDRALLQGKLSSFYQELMLQITSDDQRVIDEEDILWYSRNQLMRNSSAYNFYITTDFAVGESQHSDFSVICVWAINSTGRIFLVDGICKKQLMNVTIDDLFRLASKYKPQSVGIEISGQQAGFVSWINEQMLARNIWFTLAKEENSKQAGLRPKGGKLERFNVFLPTIKSRMFLLPLELKQSDLVKEMVHELGLITEEGFKSKHDDCVDTISMLPRMKMFAPSEEAPAVSTDSNIWENDEVVYDSPINSYLV
jgi:predicted phage terminase large subunit-like protein